MSLYHLIEVDAGAIERFSEALASRGWTWRRGPGGSSGLSEEEEALLDKAERRGHEWRCRRACRSR
jgi:hypothetical protein